MVKAHITRASGGSVKSKGASPLSFVFLVDTHRQPLSPVHPGRARILLKAGKAAVLKRYPFTLILKAAIEQPQVQPLRIKLDPGSRTTGIAIVDDESGQVLFAAELAHRSQQIKKALQDAGGNKAAAAKRLGVSRRSLYRWLERLDFKN